MKLAGKTFKFKFAAAIFAFAGLVLATSTFAQIHPFSYFRGLIELGMFSISGVGGESDSAVDAWLVNSNDVNITFTSSLKAVRYDITIKDENEVATICALNGVTASPATITGCGLVDGSTYKIFINARAGTAARSATNDGFEFTVDRLTPTPGAIIGVKGGTDTEEDAWLVGHLNPHVQWADFAGAASYNVTIKNTAETVDVCTQSAVTVSEFDFSSCGLVNNTSYKVFVVGLSPSGFNTADATNNGFVFTVDNNTISSFDIAGIVNGTTDVTVDAFLADGEDPTVNLNLPTGASFYDFVINDEEDTVQVCQIADLTTPPFVLDCDLEQGLTYVLHVTAKTASKKITADASNDGYSFSTSDPAADPSGNFSIQGVVGGEDAQNDGYLTDGLVPTLRWEASGAAAQYHAQIRQLDGTVVCGPVVTSDLEYKFTGCNLVKGTSYRAHVSASKPPALRKKALNDGFVFKVTDPGADQIMIAGVYGGIDRHPDDVLVDPSQPGVDWVGMDDDLSLDVEFEVVIRNFADTVNVCPLVSTRDTFHVYSSGCTLTEGQQYRARVTAKRGGQESPAINNDFIFKVPPHVNVCAGGVVTDSPVVLFDSGGKSGNYSNDETCSINITPSTTADHFYVEGFYHGADWNDILTFDPGGEELTFEGQGEFQEADFNVSVAGTLPVSWQSNESQVAPGFAFLIRGLDASAGSWPNLDNIGVSGGSDTVPDEILTDVHASARISWETTWSGDPLPITYKVRVMNQVGESVCPTLETTGDHVMLTSCGLVPGQRYEFLLSPIFEGSGFDWYDGYFVYQLKPHLAAIQGVTGGSDSSVDASLEDGLIPTVHIQPDPRATSYELAILSENGSTVVCPQVTLAAAATQHNFSSCTLEDEKRYLIELVAINSAGKMRAVNSPFSFKVGRHWRPMIGSVIPSGRYSHVIAWTGSEVLIWGGYTSSGAVGDGARYNPATDSWTKITNTAAPQARAHHTAVWSGSELLIWGGADQNGQPLASGARYNPGTDTWTAMAASPLDNRSLASSVWTGTEMLVWGGQYYGNALGNGARYNPATDSWTNINSTGAPSSRYLHSAVWTGSVMLIWGGEFNYFSQPTDGGLYDPTTDTWSAMAIAPSPSSRVGHVTVWSGTQMIVWGGTLNGSYQASGARYNPGTNSWTSVTTTGAPSARSGAVAVWSGTEMIMWGGEAGLPMSGGKRYNPTTNTWASISTTGEPEALKNSKAVWTGTEMFMFGGFNQNYMQSKTFGLYNPGTDSWKQTEFIPLGRRQGGASVWTGSEMLVWGGEVGTGWDSLYTNEGGKYNPTTDSWTPTTTVGAPSGRYQFAYAWTGSELIVFGGLNPNNGSSGMNDGGRYNPATDQWIAIETANAPSERYNPYFAWTGTGLLIMGGSTYVDTIDGGSTYAGLDDGGLYNPTTDTWTPLTAPAHPYIPVGRPRALSVWTGSEMLVFGGESYGYTSFDDVYVRYNPATDTWQPMAGLPPIPPIEGTAVVWTGSEAILWGGQMDWEPINFGFRYSPATESAQPLSMTNAPSARAFHTAVWTGTEMLVWGGIDADQWVVLNSGGRYNPALDEWTTTYQSIPAPPARQDFSAVWTGTEMILWGGEEMGDPVSSGARYNPTTDTWLLTSEDNTPAPRWSHSAVWTGSEMIVWGGENWWDGYLGNGGRYDPLTNTWADLAFNPMEPEGVEGHTAIWTGTEMIIWGGVNNSGYTAQGLRYDPAADQWQNMDEESAGIPAARSGHTAVWTGTEMIVWGGLGEDGTLSSGGRYNPATDSWVSTYQKILPPARSKYGKVWTGTEVIIYGGQEVSGAQTTLASGLRYNPTTDSWAEFSNPYSWNAVREHSMNWTGNSIVVYGGRSASGTISSGYQIYNFLTEEWATGPSNLPGRVDHTAIWTGNEVIVFGGLTSGMESSQGFVFNPAEEYPRFRRILTQSVPFKRYWHTAVWTGSEMIIWGGSSTPEVGLDNGSRYNPTTDTWTVVTGEDAPMGRVLHEAVWTGTEMMVWGGYYHYSTSTVGQTGGLYNPATDSWRATAIDDATPSARTGHTMVWTGTEVIVWGGKYLGVFNDGARFDPATNSWSKTFTTTIPLKRYDHTAVWTGSGMIIWGGTNAQGHPIKAGGIYNPTTDSWSDINNGLGAPAGTSLHTAVWSGAEMITWGGRDIDSMYLNSGARYNPATDTWASVATNSDLAPRAGHTAVWADSEMIVWGGTTEFGPTATGARYNPGSDSWTSVFSVSNLVPRGRDGHSSHWTGTEMLIWGGQRGYSDYLADGFKYNPSSDSWAPITTTDAPGGRAKHASVWTGSTMIVWGGVFSDGESTVYYTNGGRYNPGTDSWTAIATSGAPVRRTDASAIWTGSEMIVWGGVDHNYYPLNSGAIYNPSNNTWTATSLINAPERRSRHSTVWTGTEMIVWGGTTDDSVELATGGRFNPSTNSWQATSVDSAPFARRYHTAVWTGSEMIIWGGDTGDETSVLASGGIYTPANDTWSDLGSNGATPQGRARHSAIWTGTQMIVWGGFHHVDDEIQTGEIYQFSSGTWSAIPVNADTPEPRRNHSAVWTGNEMIVWGGSIGSTRLGSGGRYHVASATWSKTAETANNVPTARSGHTAVWTGDEMIIWGGQGQAGMKNDGSVYDPSSNTWSAVNSVNAPSARRDHSAIWTGTEMIVWGGYDNDTADGSAYTATGARYLLGSDTWSAMSMVGAPVAVSKHTATWTGSEMVVFGGKGAGVSSDQTLKYNPGSDSWDAVVNSENCSSRDRHTAVWTGSEVVIWGGQSIEDLLGDGCRLTPGSEAWASVINFEAGVAPSPRRDHTAVWTGTEMIVWGGYDENLAVRHMSGGRYNPSTNTWTVTATSGAPSGRSSHSAVWTGTEMIVWGGYTGSYVNSGGRYNPSTDTWVSTSTAGAPAGRGEHSVVWTGSQMIVWGGENSSTRYNTGGVYTPGTNSWSATSTTSAPIARSRHTGVWTGSEMIIWGGDEWAGGSSLDTGGRYNPGSNSWIATSTSQPLPGAPSGRYGHTALWTGDEMIVWGGRNSGGTYFNDGSRYIPLTDSWIALGNSGDVLSERAYHSAVLMGTEMIVWGGKDAEAYMADGSRYTFATGTWSALSSSGSPPEARHTHNAFVYNGDMYVWGGYVDQGGFDSPTATGAVYDLSTNQWSAMDSNGTLARSGKASVLAGSKFMTWGEVESSGEVLDLTTQTWSEIGASAAQFMPSARESHSAVWTGDEMIIWGGSSGFNTMQSGARYNPLTDTWTAISAVNAPEARMVHSAFWHDDKMYVVGGEGDGGNALTSGGIYDKDSDTWTAITDAPEEVQVASQVFTGSEILVWGMDSNFEDGIGLRYSLAGNSWQPIGQGEGSPNDPPPGRFKHTAVWTGSEMIVWGGFDVDENTLRDGARYNPTLNVWAPMADKPGSGVAEHHAAWTGAEMLIWGGFDNDELGDDRWDSSGLGYRYSPAANTWQEMSRTNAPTSREGASAVWTGTEFVVWGGYGDSGQRRDGGAYNPATNTWTYLKAPATFSGRAYHTAVWTGSEVLMWSGETGGSYISDGVKYVPATQTWAKFSVQGQISSFVQRDGASFVWTGTELVLWGGWDITSGQIVNTGAKYNPVTDNWTMLPVTSNAPSPRGAAGAVWGAGEMYVWGGQDLYGAKRDGGRLNPTTGVWTRIDNSESSPKGVNLMPLVWTGSKLMVWGGESDEDTVVDSGSIFDPVTGIWTPISREQDSPEARWRHVGVWTGTELIIWGGGTDGGPSKRLDSGAIYKP